MPGRQENPEDYRFGFNGKENDRDIGSQLIQDYGFRLYNPIIGKFLSVDPLTKSYPAWTPYAFAMNRVIDGIDLDGAEWRQATLEEIGLYTQNGFQANQLGIYAAGNGEYYTWVGENEYVHKTTGKVISGKISRGSSAVYEKITFDEIYASIPASDTPYTYFTEDGKVKSIYHNYELAPWMSEAWFFESVSLSEIEGDENNPIIMEMHNAAVNGWIPPNDDEAGPWCSSFACYVMDRGYSGKYQEGNESPKNASSLSWRNWGTEIDNPVYGAVAVKSRNGGGHVGFVVGQSENGEDLYILGGNQAHEVNVRPYAKDLFRFFVPEGYDIPGYSEDLPVYNNNNDVDEGNDEG